MRTHIIENERIVNTIEATVADASAAYPESICINADLGGSIGDRYVDGQFQRPTLNIEAERTAAIARTYSDVDAVYADAIGNRATEYQLAEDAARAYVAAGYSGAAPDYVADYAAFNPTGEAQTNAWAADQIIARADAFRDAQLVLRSRRFEAQAALRAAMTADELQAAMADWSACIAATRAALGL